MTGRELYKYFGREVTKEDYLEYYANTEYDFYNTLDDDLLQAYEEYFVYRCGGEKIYTDFNKLLEGYLPEEVVNVIDFENFDINSEFFRMDPLYMTVECLNGDDLIDEMWNDTDFLIWFLDTYEDYDEEEMWEIIEEANQIAEEEGE